MPQHHISSNMAMRERGDRRDAGDAKFFMIVANKIHVGCNSKAYCTDKHAADYG